MLGSGVKARSPHGADVGRTPLSLSLSLFLSLTHTHALSLPLSPSLSLTHTLSFFLSLSLSHALSLSHTQTQTYTHTHTLSLSLLHTHTHSHLHGGEVRAHVEKVLEHCISRCCEDRHIAFALCYWVQAAELFCCLGAEYQGLFCIEQYSQVYWYIKIIGRLLLSCVIDSGLVGSPNFQTSHSQREGYRERRGCSRDTYPKSYITKYTSIRR